LSVLLPKLISGETYWLLPRLRQAATQTEFRPSEIKFHPHRKPSQGAELIKPADSLTQ